MAHSRNTTKFFSVAERGSRLGDGQKATKSSGDDDVSIDLSPLALQKWQSMAESDPSLSSRSKAAYRRSSVDRNMNPQVDSTPSVLRPSQVKRASWRFKSGDPVVSSAFARRNTMSGSSGTSWHVGGSVGDSLGAGSAWKRRAVRGTSFSIAPKGQHSFTPPRPNQSFLPISSSRRGLELSLQQSPSPQSSAAPLRSEVKSDVSPDLDAAPLTGDQVSACDFMTIQQLILEHDQEDRKNYVEDVGTARNDWKDAKEDEKGFAASVIEGLREAESKARVPLVPRRTVSLTEALADKQRAAAVQQQRSSSSTVTATTSSSTAPPLPPRSASLQDRGRRGNRLDARAESTPPDPQRLCAIYYTPDDYDEPFVTESEDCEELAILKQNLLQQPNAASYIAQQQELRMKSSFRATSSKSIVLPLDRLTNEEVNRQRSQWAEVLHPKNTSSTKRRESLMKFALYDETVAALSKNKAGESATDSTVAQAQTPADMPAEGKEGSLRGVTLRRMDSLSQFGQAKKEGKSPKQLLRVGSIVSQDSSDWGQLIRNFHKDEEKLEIARSKNLKDMVRHGIPDEFRGKIWPLLAGAVKMRSENFTLYKDLVAKLISNSPDGISPWKDQIERDLSRTIIGTAAFDSEKEVASLRRVLNAFSLYHRNIGYTQSMNIFAAMLLLFMSEELTFFTLTSIVFDFLPGYYTETMSGLQIDIKVMVELLKHRAPKMSRHLSRLGLPDVLSGFLTQWFLCLFVNCLPIETCLRVWDCFFFEGPKFFFRVGLALFLVNEKSLLQCSDEVELIEQLRLLPRTPVYSDLFLEYAVSIPSFSHSWLSQLRSQFARTVDAQMSEREQWDRQRDEKEALEQTEGEGAAFKSREQLRWTELQTDLDREADRDRRRLEAMNVELDARPYIRGSWREKRY